MLRIISIVLGLTVGSQAAAFVAENSHQVNGLPDAGTFEVVGRTGSGPGDYFCAAAHYAQAVLDAPVASRVSVLRGYGASQTAPGRRGVSFIVDNGTGRRPGENRNYSLSVEETGFNLSVGMARSFCDEDLPIWRW